jgi:hypothetical protein
MKVKELIKELQKFDQEKDIWILYDRYASLVPEFKVSDEEIDDMKVGDIVCEAW